MSNASRPAMRDAIREFLREQPQHVVGTRTKNVGGVEDVLMDSATITAFAEWSIAKGYTRDAAKARRFTSWINDPNRAAESDGAA